MTNYSKRNWYAITISPPPYGGNQYYKEFEDYKYFKKILKRTSEHSVFFTEWDNLDRMHYHGLIRIDNKIKWYRCSRRKFSNVGFVNIKLIKNFTEHLRWLNYIKKDQWLNLSSIPRMWRVTVTARADKV